MLKGGWAVKLKKEGRKEILSFRPRTELNTLKWHDVTHTHCSQHLLMCSWRPLTSDKGQGSERLLSHCLSWHSRLSPHPVVAMFLKDNLPEAPKKVGRVWEITFFTTFLQLLCPFPLTALQVQTPGCSPGPCPGLWTNTQCRKASFASNISHLPQRPIRDRWLSSSSQGKWLITE